MNRYQILANGVPIQDLKGCNLTRSNSNLKRWHLPCSIHPWVESARRIHKYLDEKVNKKVNNEIFHYFSNIWLFGSTLKHVLDPYLTNYSTSNNRQISKYFRIARQGQIICQYLLWRACLSCISLNNLKTDLGFTATKSFPPYSSDIQFLVLLCHNVGPTRTMLVLN